MPRRRATIALAAICLLAPVPAASAGLRQRILAANKVEKALTAKHRTYSWTAACTQSSSTRFSCRAVGRRGTREARATARVTRSGSKYVVRLGRVTFR